MANRNLLMFCFGLSLIFLMGFTSATVQATFDAYYSVIENDGSFTDTTTPVSAFAVKGYLCANTACTIIGAPVAGLTGTTSTDSITISFPTTLQSSNGYLLYFYKDGYIGMEGSGIKVSGTGDWNGPDIYLSKKRTGWAPIMNLNVVNEVYPNLPITVGVNVGVDADTYAAIEDSRESNVPLNEDVETLVTFEIADSDGDIVYTTHKTVYVEYSGVKPVSFSYAGFDEGEEGDYDFIVYTDVTDDKILKSIRQTATSSLTVLEDTSDDYWYTLISKLEMFPVMPEVDENVHFEFNYISGYNDGVSVDYVGTDVVIQFFKDDVLISSDSQALSSGSSVYSFNRAFDEAGNYSVLVSGSPHGAPSSGVEVVGSSQEITFIVTEPAIEISCYSNSDCGNSHPVGDEYCFLDDVYQDVLFPTCVNPGESDSYCSYSNTLPWEVEECQFGCLLGVCLEQNDLEIADITCFDEVVVGHNQSCSVFVENDLGNVIGGVDVDIFYSDGSVFGSCLTNDLTGACAVKDLQDSVGSFEVYAVASGSGYGADDDTYPRFDYDVLEEAYDIVDLKVYRDSDFSIEDYDFFRGENLYVRFGVEDMEGNPVNLDLVSSVSLVSLIAGGRVDLEEVDKAGSYYYYELTPIPASHEFLGDSNIFAFVFNVENTFGGQEEVSLVIRNNPPFISPSIPDQDMNVDSSRQLNLSLYENDIEDSGYDLSWEIVSVDGDVDVNLVGKILFIESGDQDIAEITLRLYDLDGDYDEQTFEINVGDSDDDNGDDGNDCTAEWDCSIWSECIDGVQYRSCVEKGSCSLEGDDKPLTIRTCSATISLGAGNVVNIDGLSNNDKKNSLSIWWIAIWTLLLLLLILLLLILLAWNNR